MSDTPKAPTGFLSVAQQLLDDPRPTESPFGSAWMDQMLAAEHELRALVPPLQALTAMTERREGDLTPHGVAFALALLTAVERRTKRRCPHAQHEAIVAPRPVFVTLALGLASCEPCMPSMTELASMMVDDGRCDVCDEPSKLFHDSGTAIGHLFVIANLCPDCYRFTSTASGAPA
jgi:hypothetical protein